jgi:serine/threonine-protein kinase
VANSRLGNLLAQRNQSVEAEKFLRAGVQNGPDLWLPRVDLGLFLCRQDRCVEGLNELLEAARRHPNNPVVFRSLGAVYHLLGRDDEAAASLQKSLSIRPERRQYSTLGAVLFFQGKYREALGAFEKAISMGGGNDYLAWGNLADAYRFTPGYGTKAKEAYANAIELGRKALAKNPKDLSIASSIAGYLAKNGQSSEAVAQLATIEAEPGLKAGILYKCALAREITGFRELALSHLEKAVRQGYPMKEVANDPELIELRKDPRYQRISAGKN